MRLRERRAGETLAPIFIVTLSAGQVQLALPLLEYVAAGFDERARPRILRDRDRLALRVMRDINRQCQQLLAVERQRLCLLVFGAAAVDALLEVERPVEGRVESGISRRHPFHTFSRVAVAIGAGFMRGAFGLLPQRGAIEDP